jgi:uncharacterized protein (DUF427 family)
VVLDTTRAVYLWEWPHYPQYYIPVADVAPACSSIRPRGASEPRHRPPDGPAGRGGQPPRRRLYTEDAVPGLAGLVRFEWDALDAWFEEDEEVFVHPRDPYARVDALRSTRHVRVELDGVVLAESSSPVLVFETGLPTRYYLNRTEVDFTHLEASRTVTACPYKGRTTGYWSVRTPDATYPTWPGPTTSRPGSCCRSPG